MNNRTNSTGPVTEHASPIDDVTSNLTPKGEQRNTRSQSQHTPGPVDQTATQMDPEDEKDFSDIPSDTAKRSANNHWHYTFWVLIGFVGTWLGYRVGSELIGLWQRGNLLALPFTLLALALLSAFTWALFREFKAKRRVDALNEHQTQIRRALENNSLAQIQDALSPISSALKHLHPELSGEFERAAVTVDNARDYAALFNNMVLARLDEEADTIINRNTITVTVAVAIIPHPALDVAVILWKASTLIRDIGNIYGLELTALSSMKLLKHALTSAVFAVGADAAGDIALEQLGSSALAKLGKVGGQSTIVAVRLYRLGLMTKKLCRPAL